MQQLVSMWFISEHVKNNYQFTIIANLGNQIDNERTLVHITISYHNLIEPLTAILKKKIGYTRQEDVFLIRKKFVFPIKILFPFFSEEFN